MSRAVMFKFQLFVAGDALNAAQALANLRALCRAYMRRHEIEVIDVIREPKRAQVSNEWGGRVPHGWCGWHTAQHQLVIQRQSQIDLDAAVKSCQQDGKNAFAVALGAIDLPPL